jgi:hypothetical protein
MLSLIGYFCHRTALLVTVSIASKSPKKFIAKTTTKSRPKGVVAAPEGKNYAIQPGISTVCINS